MQLHELHVKKSHAKRQRVGRGGKRGTTSGRGQKGQKSRSGHRIRPAFRDLVIRIPKRRGFRNMTKSAKSIVLNVGDLEVFSGTITKDTLIKAGIINKREKDRDIKLLGSGEVTKALTIEGLSVSKSATMKIEKAGGKVIPLAR